MQNNGKSIENKRGNVVSRVNQPSSALGFINNEQLRNRSSMSKYQTLQKDHAFRSSYSPNPKIDFREPSPLSWKVGNVNKNNTASGGVCKQKTYNVSKKSQNKANSSFGHYTNMTQKSNKTSIKSK